MLGSEYFPEVDEDTARGILAEVERLATGPIAESFAEADRNPPVFDPATSSVRMPGAFKKSFQAFMDAEWFRLVLPAAVAALGRGRTDRRRQPRGLDVRERRVDGQCAVADGHAGAATVRLARYRA